MPSEERNMSWKIRPTWNGAAMHFSSLWQLSVQSEDKSSVLGNTSQKKNWFLSGIAQITSPPPPHPLNSGKLYFGCQKRCLARITEPCNDNVIDNCDHNFCAFDDFGVKNDRKVSHNMILMSKYKGQHGGKKSQQIRARPPPFFGQWPKEIDFCDGMCSLRFMTIWRSVTGSSGRHS